ncbi:MAG: NDP-sugar synthase [Lautropia sp.]
MPGSIGRDLVGLVPAAGRATRISPLPCSKELLPIGWQRDPADATRRPKVVSQYLLERMQAAGASRVFFIVRDGKWDIARYYGDGSRLGLPIGYLNVGAPWGPPFTLSQAAPFIGDADVVFGFPDILVQPVDSFSPLLARMDTTGADVVLGLFECRADEPGDVVERHADGRVASLVTKEERPVRPDRYVCWMFAVWRASFTRFMREECGRLARVAAARVAEDPLAKAPEWPVGAIVAAAIRAGLHVDSHFFAGGRFLDVGTPEGLTAAPAFPLVWDGLGDPAADPAAAAPAASPSR